MGSVKVKVFCGDITKEKADAIVNSTNATLNLPSGKQINGRNKSQASSYFTIQSMRLAQFSIYAILFQMY